MTATDQPPADADRTLLYTTDHEGRPLLSCLVKRAYLIADGQCHLAPEPSPLLHELLPEADDERILARDADIYPLKPRCDVVVRGRAWNPGRERSFPVALQVGAGGSILRAIGERRVTRSGGRIVFSDPEPLESVPLHAGSAYGGVDLIAEQRHGNPMRELQPYLPPAQQPEVERYAYHHYPRNPAGRGYVLADDADSLAACRLPLLEDPDDLLTPERLVLGAREAWPGQPLPGYFGWMDLAWFPRGCFFGIREHCEPPATWPEVTRGLLAAERCEPLQPPRLDHASSNGAHLGLRFDELRGDEKIALTNGKQGQPRWQFRLPGQRPRIALGLANGKTAKGKAVLQTVDLEPDADRVELVWRLAVPADRPYRGEDLAAVPIEVRW